MLTIGEAAERLGLSASAIRYYDKEGLLPFVDRTAGGIRLFREEDLDWLRLIECLKATDMPIKDIRRFIDWYREGDGTLAQRRDMFYQRRQAVEAQIEALQTVLGTIKYKCWFYDKAVELGSIDAAHALRPEDIPEDICKLKQGGQ